MVFNSKFIFYHNQIVMIVCRKFNECSSYCRSRCRNISNSQRRTKYSPSNSYTNTFHRTFIWVYIQSTS